MRPLFSDKATRKKLLRRTGLIASIVLLFLLLRQINLRVSQTAGGWGAIILSSPLYFLGSLLLLPVGFWVEAYKWRLLLHIAGAKKVSFRKSLRSVLCGTAASAVTPNRIGDYPGRVLALKDISLQNGTMAGALGAGSQFATLFIWAIPATLFTKIPGSPLAPAMGAIITISLAFIAILIYLYAHLWVAFLLRIPFLRRFVPQNSRKSPENLRPVSKKSLWMALGWSLVRFAVYTTQFWLLLHWLSVPMMPAQGWMKCAFFFSLLAVIPNFALAEIGVRGTLALFLFDTNNDHTAAVFMATLLLWITNLALPSLLGWVLWVKTIKPSAKNTVQSPIH